MFVNYPHSRRTQHPTGFTLVEVMVVTTIVAILASTLLFALAGANDAARRRRTSTQVAKIHELIAERWESYETRSVQLSPAFKQSLRGSKNARNRNSLRIQFLRELMRLEMPDRMLDVTSDRFSRAAPTAFPGSPNLNSALHKYYRSKVKSSWTPEHESAECLYLIISRIELGDGFALDVFPEREIGDTDGDGMLELLDAWGKPFQFVRWPAGFNQASAYQSGPGADNASGDGTDAFDFTLSDPRLSNSDPNDDPYAIFPLIVSAGSDKLTNIFPNMEDSNRSNVITDPYHGINDAGIQMEGALANQGANEHIDNITNHALGLSN